MKISLTLSLCVVLSVTTLRAQFSNGSPGDAITTGQFAEKNPVLSLSPIPLSSSVQWLLFERYTEDSSYIVGKKFFTDQAAWDTTETIIARSPKQFPLINPKLAGYITGLFCAVWQKDSGGVRNLRYSLYNNSIQKWMEPARVFTSSASQEHPAVLAQSPFSSSYYFSVLWSQRNVIFHASLILGSNTVSTIVVDSIVTKNKNTVLFDVADHAAQRMVAYFSDDTSSSVFYTSRFSPSLFGVVATDSFVVPSKGKNLRFLPVTSIPYLFWEQNDGNDTKIVGTNWDSINFQHIYSDVMVTGLKYDVRMFATSVVTGPKMRHLTDIVLAYTWEYDNDTNLVIYNPASVDTIRTAGYNKSAAIGTFFSYQNNQKFNLVVWESNRTGTPHIYGKLVYNSLTSVERTDPVAQSYALHQNFPNPFNPSTVISYQLSKVSMVTLNVYDILGREVAELVNEEQQAGEYSIPFNASHLASGMYFYHFRSGEFSSVKKMVIIK